MPCLCHCLSLQLALNKVRDRAAAESWAMATLYDIIKLMLLPILYIQEQTTASVYTLEEGPPQTEVE